MPRSQVWDGNQWVDMTDATSGVSTHDDLAGVTADQHHARYSDAEAQAANPPGLHHFVQTNAPSAPVVGDVWVNPDEPPEGTYLPLTGGTLTGNLVLDGGYFTIQRTGSGLMWLKRTSNPETVDGWFQFQIQGGGGLSIYAGSLDGTTRPQAEKLRLSQESIIMKNIALDFEDRDSQWQYLRKKTGPGFLFETAVGESMRHYDVTTLIWDSSLTAFRSYRPIWSEHADGFSSRASTPVYDWRPSGATTYRWSSYVDAGDHWLKFFANEQGKHPLMLTAAGVGYIGGSSSSSAIAFQPIGTSYRGVTHSGYSANWIGFTWGSSAIWGTVDNVVTIQVSNSSDRRLKHDIRPVPSALDIIEQMPPLYIHKGKGIDGELDDEDAYSMMADEMEKVFPFLVTGDGKTKLVSRPRVDEDGNDIMVEELSETYQTINYMTMVPLIAAALKELTAEVRGG